MRQILFKGKRKDNGEWKYGDLLQETSINHCSIFGNKPVDENVSVIPETVGQYTGLKDKSGKMIFEGDKIKAYFSSNRSKQEFKVSFERGSFLFDNGYVKANERDLFSLEVIGNIHDNPELLKEGV